MNKTKIFAIVSLLFLLAFPLMEAALPAEAMEAKGISILPARTKEYPDMRAWFVYEAEPGAVIKDKVDVMNRGNQSLTLILAGLDGAVTHSGGYTLVGNAEQNKDIGNWVKLETEKVTLPPRSRQTLDFTVTVPLDADVGSHEGGLITWEAPQEVSASKQKGGSQLTVVTRVAARMYLTVPGEIIRRLEVSHVSHSFRNGVLYFALTMKNNGNVRVEPSADITLRGWLGRIDSQDASQLGLLLKNTEITAQSPWNRKAPSFGRFVADFRIHYGEKDFAGQYVKDEYVDVRYVFWLVPWLKILLVIGLLLLLILIRNLWLWLLIQSRLNTKTKQHKVKPGQTLTAIAALYQMHPKQIAKFNLLRWPYELHSGEVLLIPQGRLSRAEKAKLDREWVRQVAYEQSRIFWGNWIILLPLWRKLFGRIRFRHLRRAAGVIARRPKGGEAISRLPRFARNDMKESGSVAMTKSTAPIAATEVLITEKGDTIYDIAEFAGVDVDEVIRLNNLRPPYRLRAGQEVIVPVTRKAVTKLKRAAKKPTQPSTERPPKNKGKKRK